MLEVRVPDNIEALVKGIKALEAVIKKDTDMKSKEIHEDALREYQDKLEAYKTNMGGLKNAYS